MTALAMAKWFETPCFYPLSLSHHLLPLLHAAAGSLPSNLQPPDSPRRDPELPALQTPPTSALWVLPQIPLEKYYWWWLVWRVGVPGQRPSLLHECVLQAAALLLLHPPAWQIPAEETLRIYDWVLAHCQ